MIQVLHPPAAPELLRWTRVYPPASQPSGRADYAQLHVSKKRAKGTPLRRYFQRASHRNGPKMLRSAQSDAPCVLIRCDVFCNGRSVVSTQFRDLQRNRAAGCAGRRLKHAHITQDSNIYHERLREFARIRVRRPNGCSEEWQHLVVEQTCPSHLMGTNP